VQPARTPQETKKETRNKWSNGQEWFLQEAAAIPPAGMEMERRKWLINGNRAVLQPKEASK